MKDIDLNKYKKTIGIGLIIGLLFIGTLTYLDKGKEKEILTNNKDEIFVREEKSKEVEVVTNNTEKKEKKILVDIKGEVVNPGVYELIEGDIVEELIKKAGGLTEEGTLETINRAKALNNNEAIIIPNKEDLENKVAFNNPEVNLDSANGNIQSSTNLINLNTAKSEELQKLSGIGEGKASAIIEYREKNGGFKSIEEIKNVSGIGAATFEKIKEDISV